MRAGRWSKVTRLPRSDVAALVAIIAIAVGLVVVLTPRGESADSRDAQPPAGPLPAMPVADAQTETALPMMLFIGDSYTGGNSTAERSPSCRAATRVDWLCALSGIHGSGYICGGPANRFLVDPFTGMSRSMIERIPGLALRYRPQIVVLDGGRNDWFVFDKIDVFKAMRATIIQARRSWPEAKLVFERPRFIDHPGNDLGLGDLFIANVLASTGVPDVELIDPIRRITGDTSGLLTADGKHPNERGEQLLADALVDELSEHGLVTPT